MKNIFKSVICLGTGVLMATSCSDFLDQTSPSEMFPDVVYNNESFAEQTITSIYSGLTKDVTYGSRFPFNYSMNTDTELADAIAEDKVKEVGRRGACNYNPSVDWADLPKSWKEMYSMIEKANSAIEGIKGSSNQSAKMKQYLGEALTLRAMLYFDLVRNFGDVPMKMEPSKSDLSNVDLPKTDRDIIMDQLLLDLQEAAGYLPWASASRSTEHITKGFALGLAARIALFEGGYSIREAAKEGYVNLSEKREGQQGYSDAVYPTMRPGDAKRTELYTLAAKCLAQVINEGPHKLNPSYKDEWTKINERTLDYSYFENVFEIAHGLDYSGEMGYTAGVRLSTDGVFGKGNSSGAVKVPAPMFYKFDAQDLRRDVTCAPYELRNAEATQTLTNNPFNGIYVGKWDVRLMGDEWKLKNLAKSTKWGYGINWVMMRYSDILLMYAEAVNELSGPNGTADGCALTAKEALRQVRARAFASADQAAKVDAVVDAASGSKDAFFNAVVDERALEFVGEAVRKYDLVRWGLLIDKIVVMLDDYRLGILNDKYPAKLWYNEATGVDAWYLLDYSSIQWYEEPVGTAYAKSASWFGSVKKSDGSIDYTNANYSAIQFLCNGLIQYDKEATGATGFLGTAADRVVNRHLLPIGANTLNTNNGAFKNSYDY